jgi:hypothetical protein
VTAGSSCSLFSTLLLIRPSASHPTLHRSILSLSSSSITSERSGALRWRSRQTDVRREIQTTDIMCWLAVWQGSRFWKKRHNKNEVSLRYNSSHPSLISPIREASPSSLPASTHPVSSAIALTDAQRRGKRTIYIYYKTPSGPGANASQHSDEVDPYRDPQMSESGTSRERMQPQRRGSSDSDTRVNREEEPEMRGRRVDFW